MIYMIFLLIIASNLIAFAQDSKSFLRKGNEQYKKEKFNEAEINYRKSLEKDNKSHKALFNLGDALYKQEQYDKAAKEFASIANRDINDQVSAQAYHNLANSLLKSGKIEESIEAYKNSLRKNPEDKDTKYNLEYARRLLQQQKQQNKQDQKNKKDNQDKKQDQDQNQDQNNKDNQDQKDENKQGQNQQDQKGKQDQKEQQGSKEQKISQKDAERILQALMQEEKKLQEKLKKKVKGSRGKLEKQW